MPFSKKPANTTTDRIKLPMQFNTSRIARELGEINLDQYTIYNMVPLRAPAHNVDPSIPVPPPTKDYADGSWTKWLNMPILDQSPYLSSVVDTFGEQTKVNLVKLFRLPPGVTIAEHSEPTLGIQVPRSVVRFTIPIKYAKGAAFNLNKKPVPMQAGECWYLRLTDSHGIVNASSSECIILTIDVVPNEWVKSLIYDNQPA